jgi:hypothetical protein
MATYYVDASAANDLGNGAISTPFKTITHAISHISGGDIIYLRAGTYNERVYMSGKSGTEGSPTIISGYADEEAIIDGTGITVGDGSYLMQLSTTDYITLTKFTMTNVSMEDLTISAGSGVYLNGTGCNISYLTVYNTNGSAIRLGDSSSNSIVEYCTCYNNCMNNSDGLPFGVDGKYWGVGINIRGTGNILRHCIVHDCWGEGMSITKATGDTMEDNVVYDCYSSHMYCMNSVNCLVQRNLIYQTKTMGWDDNGITPHWSTGLHHGNESYVTYIHNTNNTIINNICVGLKVLFHISSLNGGLFANNTAAYSNSTLYATYLGGDITRDWADSGLPEWGILLGGDVCNNIILQGGSIDMTSTSSVTGNTYSNNLWSRLPSIYARGTNDITDDPEFTEEGADPFAAIYYRLSATSPAIRTGINKSVLYDYEEKAWGNPPSIGAFEYNGPPIVITKPNIHGWHTP